MVEVSRKFPSPEMLDRLAEALEIETYQLFDVSATPEGALLHLERSIVSNIEQVIADAIEKNLSTQCKK